MSTDEGFTVCDSEHGLQKVLSKIPGGVSLCDSYKNSNIFFFVGTGNHVNYPTSKLCIWNSETNQLAGEVQFNLSLRIVNLIVKSDWVLVVFKDRCKLFHFDLGFTTDRTVKEFLTQPNTSHKSGQVAMHTALDESFAVVAFADAEHKGRIQLLFFSDNHAMIYKERAIYASGN